MSWPLRFLSRFFSKENLKKGQLFQNKQYTASDSSSQFDTKEPERLVFVDIETTGLNPKEGHRIVSFAAVEFINGQYSKKAIYLVFNPERSSEYRASQVHGFDAYTLYYQQPIQDYIHQISDFLNDCKIVAHNAAFEEGFLNAEFERFGLGNVQETVCTMEMYRKWIAGAGHQHDSLKLDHVANYLNVESERGTRHDALEDALLCASVYFTMQSGTPESFQTITIPALEKITRPTNFIEPPAVEQRDVRDVSPKMVAEAYEKFGSKSAAAKFLGISRTTVSNHLKQSDDSDEAEG